MNRSLLLLLITFWALPALKAGAQDSTSGKYPSAVLVQLRSEHNRIDYYKKRGDLRQMEQVAHDGEEVRKRMISDFKDHFHWCPVYYYLDTNTSFIRNKQFAGILLDSAGAPVKNPAIDSKSHDYVVVYFGRMLSQGHGVPVQKDSSLYTYDPDPPNGKGLIVLNSDFLQLGYYYHLNSLNIFRFRKKTAKYYYESKRYDMGYYPFAGELNKALSACGSEANVNQYIKGNSALWEIVAPKK